MTDRESGKNFTPILWLIGGLWLVSGCQAMDHSVIASTGTVIGVEVSYDAATQNPQGKLGYNRAEVAIVPTNRGPCTKKKDGTFECAAPQGAGGAKDTTDVLMELRYKAFSWKGTGSSGGIYQRLAVGKTAVKQPGASLMFAKDPDGKLSKTAKAALEAVKKIPAPDPKMMRKKAVIVEKFRTFLRNNNSGEAQKFEAVAKAKGYPKSSRTFRNYHAFRDFWENFNTTMAEVEEVQSALETLGITFEDATD